MYKIQAFFGRRKTFFRVFTCDRRYSIVFIGVLGEKQTIVLSKSPPPAALNRGPARLKLSRMNDGLCRSLGLWTFHIVAIIHVSTVFCTRAHKSKPSDVLDGTLKKKKNVNLFLPRARN